MNKETYKMTNQKQKRDKNTSLCCVSCGEDNPSVIELHHIDGRFNSNKVIPLCKNCHFKVTAEQNKISPKARSENASPVKKRGFQFVSLGALLKEVGQQLINFGHEMIKNE